MSAATPLDPAAHRDFLNRTYGWTRSIYDLTRKHYLFGRDTVLEALLREPWEGLVEVGPGTGRNLAILRARRPKARLGGVEACDEMLEHAQARLPEVRFVHGFAETASYAGLLGLPADRVLFSYCLSMVQDPGAALDRALDQVAPGGEVVVVDFADLGGLPWPLAGLLRAWLAAFHVVPLDEALLDARGATVSHGPGRYWLQARLRRPG
ncbi:MAG: methyltransferase domain-containing protein [Alphaproteobacteria bacterium]|nr:methyltransferase domain-containing protein [Alphaproteobacteria bacterium]